MVLLQQTKSPCDYLRMGFFFVYRIVSGKILLILLFYLSKIGEQLQANRFDLIAVNSNKGDGLKLYCPTI